MAAHYHDQVATLASALNADENRAEAAELLRKLIDRIELTPNVDGKLKIDLYRDLAGILTMASNRNGRPEVRTADLVQQVKLVAGVGFGLDRTCAALRYG